MGKSVPPCDDRKSFSLPEQHRAIPEDPDLSPFFLIHFICFIYFTWIIIFHILVLILLVLEFVYLVYPCSLSSIWLKPPSQTRRIAFLVFEIKIEVRLIRFKMITNLYYKIHFEAKNDT